MTRQQTLRQTARIAVALVSAVSTFGTAAALLGSRALAQIAQAQTEICPHTGAVQEGAPASVRRSDLRVGLLRAGATAAEVERVLGRPIAAIALDLQGSGDDEFVYADEPLRTRVVLTSGRVTEITLDLAYFDPTPLPARARAVKPTMARGGVISLLGGPDGDDRWTESGIEIEQMLFAAPDEREFSVVLAGGQVVDARLGHTRPSGISCMLLPTAVPESTVGRDLKIGLSPAQVASLLGPAARSIASSFKGQPVEYTTYHGPDGGGPISVTFIGGVLTAFKIWPPDAS